MGGGPAEFAGGGIERDDAGFGAADVDEDIFFADERRAGESEKAFAGAECFAAIDCPVEAASEGVSTFDDAVCAEGVHAAFVYGGHGARAVVEAELIHVGGIGNAFPNHRSAGGVHAFEDFLLVLAVEMVELAVGYGGAGKARADVLFPNLFRPIGGPFGEGFAVVSAIAARAEELRPIFSTEESGKK